MHDVAPAPATCGGCGICGCADCRLLDCAEELAATGASLFDVLTSHVAAGWVRGLTPGADSALAAEVHARAAPGRIHWSRFHITEREDEDAGQEDDQRAADQAANEQLTQRARAIAGMRGLGHLHDFWPLAQK